MFKVALCSFLFQKNRSRDLESICKAVKTAGRQRCNLVCFPECALSGLSTDDYKKDVKLAVKIPGRIIQKISVLARTYKIYVAIGLLEQVGKRIYDCAVLVSDQGKIVLKYRRINPKWHTKNAPKSVYKEGQIIKTTKTP